MAISKDISVEKTLVAGGNYDAEDVMSESASAGTAYIFRRCSGSGRIIKARALCSTTGLAPLLTMFLFRKLPTSNLNDNVANTAVLVADKDNYLGRIDFPAMEDLGGVSEALAVPGSYGNLPLEFNALDDDTIYGILVTRDAITGEAAGMTMTVVITVEP